MVFSAVINQMDTSQTHLSSKGGAPTRDAAKPDNLSKDELNAVLKYGAQKMFDKDEGTQSRKLDEMDLDDILNRAEDHETAQADAEATTSLGGEAFLATFAAVTDVKNDMAWEDIIPLEERQRFDAEADVKRAEELASTEGARERKRNAATVRSYEGMDVDQPAPSAPAKKAKPVPQRKTAGQKAMELKERDLRVLIRSMQRWGDIRVRYDVIVEEAKLKDKDRGMIRDTVDEIISMCTHAVDDNEAQKRERQAAGETLTNAQKSKAVLVTYRNVNNINAETVVSRNRDLRILYDHLHQLADDDLYDWAIPSDNIRPTLNWTPRWGPRDDAMLLIGAFVHGFGNWEAIQKDARLGLEGKFFLEEGKKGEDAANRPIPNAIHLVRRGDFLLGLLREYDDKIQTYEKDLKRKHGGGTSHSAAHGGGGGGGGSNYKMSLSPPPAASSSTAAYNGAAGSSLKRRAESEAVNSVDDNRKKKRRPTPTFTDSESSDEWCVALPWCLSCSVLTVGLSAARQWTRA
jgi:chromodomain-helicase-DNA-binding protein 1